MGNSAVRISEDWNEILDTLEEIQAEGSPVAIWESDGERQVEKGVTWSLDLDEGQIDFHQKGSDFNHLKNKNTTIYFKGKEKSILFKQSNILPLGDHLLIDIPQKVNLYERRGEERIHFGYQSGHFARITLTKKGKDYDFVYSVFDISPNGMALNISTEEESLFSNGDTIHIHAIGQNNLMIPHKAEIRHKGHMDFIEGGVHLKRIKLGLKFSKNLNLLCFSELITDC